MNFDSLNKWMTLLSNLAVLAGIVFLGYELQQNNEIARAQSRSEVSRISVENTRMFQNPINLEIITKIENGEELSMADETWLFQAFRSEIKSWENVYYQYRIGLLDEPELEAYRVTWKTRLTRCARLQDALFAQQYARTRSSLEPNFRQEMDALRGASDCNEIQR